MRESARLTQDEKNTILDGLYHPNFPHHRCEHCDARAPKWNHKPDCAWVQARANVEKARKLVIELASARVCGLDLPDGMADMRCVVCGHAPEQHDAGEWQCFECKPEARCIRYVPRGAVSPRSSFAGQQAHMHRGSDDRSQCERCNPAGRLQDALIEHVKDGGWASQSSFVAGWQKCLAVFGVFK